MTANQLVCFQSGSETFGIDISVVREIVRPGEITRVPGTPESVLGVMNLRGRILSIVDLSQRLGLGSTQTERSSRIVVVQPGTSYEVGFLVDAATEVVKLEPESIEPAPETNGSFHHSVLRGIGKIEQHLVLLLDVKMLVQEVGQPLPSSLSAMEPIAEHQ